MNSENLALASNIINKHYVEMAQNNFTSIEKKVQCLLQKQKLPEHGWSDNEIQILLHQLSSMDTNNFANNVGAGEREGRIFNDLVCKRHFGLSHGIGRSGDISAVQPKAAGSSLINRLTNSLLLDILKVSGSPSTTSCFLVPMATGMTLTFAMLYLRWQRPQGKYVIWPRIDQKSCLKSILTAGFHPLIVEPILHGDELQTNMSEVESLVNSYGDEILCIMTTTSCFAPRVPDKLVQISQLCKRQSIPHLVNNAYGVQIARCMNLIEQSHKQHGRIDYYVQSVDKNLMVPVGGAFVGGFDKVAMESLSKFYPGRASASPSVDVFITLLSMGRSGWMRLNNERKLLYDKLRSDVDSLCHKYQHRLLNTPQNQISLAVSLENLVESVSPTMLGSMLFTRGVSGARVVPASSKCPTLSLPESSVNIGGFGCHSSAINQPYLNVAAAIGGTESEVNRVIAILDDVLSKHSNSLAADED